MIWAAGEFQYPQLSGFTGSELCLHTSTIDSYEELDGDNFIIIGGYESGVDAAYHLAYNNKYVHMIDRACPWIPNTSDPSKTLSPFSLERMQQFWFEERVHLLPDTTVISVHKTKQHYVVTTQDGTQLSSEEPPLLAGGFLNIPPIIADLFEAREDGFPTLNEQDESSITPGLFLCGPAVRHDDHSFCFIYKFRQRFAVVAKAIADAMDLPTDDLEVYRKWNMFLDDLSCCGQECLC